MAESLNFEEPGQTTAKRPRVKAGTDNPFYVPPASERGPFRDGSSPDKAKPDTSQSYKQRGVPAGALGNAIDAIVGRRNPE